MTLTDEEIENEPQHVTYIDELLWALEDTECQVSDGIEDWLESLKDKFIPSMSFVYHAGSGTYFGAGDGAFIIDLEGLAKSDYYVDDDLDGYRWEQLEPHARPVVDCLKG